MSPSVHLSDLSSGPDDVRSRKADVVVARAEVRKSPRLCENSDVEVARRISVVVETDCTGNFSQEKAIEKTILRVLGSSEFSHNLGPKGDIRLGHLSKSRREVLRVTGRRNPHIVGGSPQAYP